ncbi:RHS repeat-associated core domain-containing protein [Bremerella cremea]|uniref:RHS repeat-associated core domain-containing protein n=1 Tax=Bremerella cremea TaxID=1031537 RepID=A0A368KTQ1_9BACT|nr:RHS repeat-associated core domain-containing protein [Bremerella cremea]RCS49492.1 RHS repeat-associated core domain-containing protein [Bremerella cremea]
MKTLPDCPCVGCQGGIKSTFVYSLSDANGNIVGLISEAEDYLNRLITYDPYGTPTGEYDFQHLFGGYYYDSTTGLYLVRNRVYHPKLGRWLTKDPLGMVDGPNLYGYCGGDPINAVDPSGTVSFWDDPLDWGYGPGGAVWDVGASQSWIGRAYQGAGQSMAEMLGPEYLAQAGGWELIGLTAAAATAGVLGGLAASSVAGTMGLGYWSTLAFSGAAGGGAEYLTWTIGARALGGNLAAGPTLGGLGWHSGAGAVGGVVLGGVGRAVGWGFRQVITGTGRGLIGLVKPGGTVDSSLVTHYSEIARAAQMTSAIRRYNAIAKWLGQKPSASSEEILEALASDVTFSRVGHLRSGLFDFGNQGEIVYGANQIYAVGKRFWLQGNPFSAYGRRAGRHELLHLGAALRGQGDNYIHEIAVQAATTPENLVLAGSLIGGPVGFVWWWTRS